MRIAITAVLLAASIVLTEFKSGLDEYLPTLRPSPKGVARSLQEIVDYNIANPVEGLKYQQRELLDALAIVLSDPATLATYEANKADGLASYRALIDGILNSGGTPVPMFADGGIATRPTPGIFGEAGPEALIPLDRMGDFGGGNTYQITVNAGVGDPRAIGKSVVEAITLFERSSGPVFARA